MSEFQDMNLQWLKYIKIFEECDHKAKNKGTASSTNHDKPIFNFLTTDTFNEATETLKTRHSSSSFFAGQDYGVATPGSDVMNMGVSFYQRVIVGTPYSWAISYADSFLDDHL